MVVNISGKPPINIRASNDLKIQVYDGGALEIIDELEGGAVSVALEEIDGLIKALSKAKEAIMAQEVRIEL